MAVEKVVKAEEAGQCSTASPLMTTSAISAGSTTDRSGQTDGGTMTSSATSSGTTGVERRSIRVQIRYWGRALADFWHKRSPKRGGSHDETVHCLDRADRGVVVMGRDLDSAPATAGVRESFSWPQTCASGASARYLTKEASRYSVAVCPEGAHDWPFIDDE